MSPIVGISQCLDDRGRWRMGRDYVYVDLAYARAVESAGGTPLHLPPQADAEALLSRIDALLIPGGDDFVPTDPSRYPRDIFEPTPRTQLDFDARLLDAALARGLPVLGICYGMQLIALRHGGTLHYHLPIDIPGARNHALSEAGRHPLRMEAGTRLARILGDAPAAVNSIHHQAVDDPGTGLRVSARSGDAGDDPASIVEAIESTGPEFVIGVQWHPEKLEGGDRTVLFRALVGACQESAASAEPPRSS